MTAPKTRQRGMSFSGAMLMLAVGSFFLTLLFKLGPAYMTFWQVRSAMDNLLTKPELGQQGPGAIITALDKQLYINEVRTVDKNSFSVVATKDGKGLEVMVDYTDQRHVGFNVDALMTFQYSVIVPKNPT